MLLPVAQIKGNLITDTVDFTYFSENPTIIELQSFKCADFP